MRETLIILVPAKLGSRSPIAGYNSPFPIICISSTVYRTFNGRVRTHRLKRMAEHALTPTLIAWIYRAPDDYQDLAT